jgi:hypothetical protein
MEIYGEEVTQEIVKELVPKEKWDQFEAEVFKNVARRCGDAWWKKHGLKVIDRVDVDFDDLFNAIKVRIAGRVREEMEYIVKEWVGENVGEDELSEA